jgi:formylglycine-generating enzyme required for sulfatase activity/serine/threonine protein kinase
MRPRSRGVGDVDAVIAANALPIGTRVERYVVLSVLGAGGFGVTYLAEHELLKKTFAVKEHFPTQFAARDSANGNLTPTDLPTYKWALERFSQEARVLAHCKHPNIVAVTDILEANNTAYMVLEYESGQSLADWLDALRRRPTQRELDALVVPLLDALAYVHERGLLHRDIAPDNIVVRKSDGSPCLIDFGAAREDVAGKSRAMSAIIKPGYSPPEQYARLGKAQGPWSDIYALAATLYRAVAGKAPQEATERQLQDELKPFSEILGEEHRYRGAFLSTIEAGLRLTPSERPQSVEEFSERLMETEERSPSIPRFLQKEKEPRNEPPRVPDDALSFVRRLRRWAGRSEAPIAGLPPEPSSYFLERFFQKKKKLANGPPPVPEEAHSVRRSEAPIEGLPPVPSAGTAMRRPVRFWVLRIGVAMLAVGVGLYGGFEYTHHAASQRIRLEQETARLAAEQAAQEKIAERTRLEAEEKRFREGAERAFEAMRKAEQEVQRERESKSKPAAFTPPLDRPMTAEEEQHLHGREEFQECKDCPRMVVVPAGKFTMGSPKNEEGRSDSEDPQHTVTIAKAFSAGQYAVTRGEFDVFVRETDHVLGDSCFTYDTTSMMSGIRWREHVGKSFRNPSFAQDDRDPVVCVSWDDARAFVGWLSQKTNKPYRLLTEAEREYLTRGGSMTPFWWGSSISTTQANYDGNYSYSGGAKGEWRKKTVAVDSFKPNPWGFYNVHGNVWEWVEDCWHGNYQGAPVDGSAWTTGECEDRVLRGGGWSVNPWSVRSAFRYRFAPSNRFSAYGFRVARALLVDVQHAGLPEKSQPREPVSQPQPPPIAVSPAPSPAQCDGVETFVGNERRCLKLKETFRDCSACPEMVVVPAGSFTMGSPETEPERTSDEVQMSVSIAQSFAVGKFAVTFDEWDDCIANEGCNGYKPVDQGWGRGKHPVINVNWDDAKAYAAWLSRKTGKAYRLPSEAEREYVTRAGTTTPFWWGSSITTAQANYDGNSTYGGGSKGEYRQRTVPVDSFLANPWGVYDLHGNVWEWTEDCWKDTNTGNPGDGSARTFRDCSHRVVRGGSWASYPRRLRSAFRGRSISVDRNSYQGVRLARTLDPAGPASVTVPVPVPVPARTSPGHSHQNDVIERIATP